MEAVEKSQGLVEQLCAHLMDYDEGKVRLAWYEILVVRGILRDSLHTEHVNSPSRSTPPSGPVVSILSLVFLVLLVLKIDSFVLGSSIENLGNN